MKIPISIDQDNRFGAPEGGWRLRAYVIIFESDTRAGRIFDLVLISLIMLSVAVVMLDSIEAVRTRCGRLFNVLEWFFTAIFSIEYLLRLLCVRRPMRYARSVFGVIDLLAVAPTYLAMFFPGLHALIDVRVLRLLRIFRILKMGAYVSEFRYLGSALMASRRKIAVFMSFVMMVVIVMGTLMYVIEGPANGFTSVPVAIYWAITTVTTVGFGDITPRTDLGRLIAACMMLIGWGTLAVPTGIVSAEFMALRERQPTATRKCHKCLSEGHLPSARFCMDCGTGFSDYQNDKDIRQV
ncbi:MAG: ion transporter [Victivallales bacterium]